MEHNINLDKAGTLPAGLEAKRRRCWAALTPEEHTRVVEIYSKTLSEAAGVIPFRDLKDTRQRVLYALAASRTALSSGEVCYLLIARWFKNVDRHTVRSRLADLAIKGQVFEDWNGRFSISQAGRKTLHEIKREWLQKETAKRHIESALVNYRRTSRTQKKEVG